MRPHAARGFVGEGEFAFGFADEELELLRTSASILPPLEREVFLWLVADKLSSFPPQARGLNLAHRLAAELLVLPGPGGGG